MITQTITRIFDTFNLLDLALFEDDQQPVAFSASELGYEISEEELVNELNTAFPDNLVNRTASQISPDEFEAAYSWFIS